MSGTSEVELNLFVSLNLFLSATSEKLEFVNNVLFFYCVFISSRVCKLQSAPVVYVFLCLPSNCIENDRINEINTENIILWMCKGPSDPYSMIWEFSSYKLPNCKSGAMQ